MGFELATPIPASECAVKFARTSADRNLSQDLQLHSKVITKNFKRINLLFSIVVVVLHLLVAILTFTLVLDNDEEMLTK